MTWLTGLLSLRNVAIIAGLCLTAFAVQSLRIKWLKSTQANLKANIVTLNQTISNYKETQTTNLEAITTLQEANQQCALGKQIIASNTKLELTRQQGRIADITDKYEKLRNTKKTTGCNIERIDADLYDRLHKD